MLTQKIPRRAVKVWHSSASMPRMVCELKSASSGISTLVIKHWNVVRQRGNSLCNGGTSIFTHLYRRCPFELAIAPLPRGVKRVKKRFYDQDSTQSTSTFCALRNRNEIVNIDELNHHRLQFSLTMDGFQAIVPNRRRNDNVFVSYYCKLCASYSILKVGAYIWSIIENPYLTMTIVVQNLEWLWPVIWS